MAAPHMMYFHNGPVGIAMPPSPALGLGFAGLQIEGRSLVFYFRCFVPESGGVGGRTRQCSVDSYTLVAR